MATGELGGLCTRHAVGLLTVFGSVLVPGRQPNDLDIAVRFDGEAPDVLGFLDELSAVADTSRIDLLDLRRAGPVARERGLLGEPLFEVAPSTFAREQIAAMMERMDTDWLRELQLELMAQ